MFFIKLLILGATYLLFYICRDPIKKSNDELSPKPSTNSKYYINTVYQGALFKEEPSNRMDIDKDDLDSTIKTRGLPNNDGNGRIPKFKSLTEKKTFIKNSLFVLRIKLQLTITKLSNVHDDQNRVKLVTETWKYSEVLADLSTTEHGDQKLKIIQSSKSEHINPVSIYRRLPYKKNTFLIDLRVFNYKNMHQYLHKVGYSPKTFLDVLHGLIQHISKILSKNGVLHLEKVEFVYHEYKFEKYTECQQDDGQEMMELNDIISSDPSEDNIRSEYYVDENYASKISDDLSQFEEDIDFIDDEGSGLVLMIDDIPVSQKKQSEDSCDDDQVKKKTQSFNFEF